MSRSTSTVALILIVLLAFGAGWGVSRLLAVQARWPSTRPMAALDRPPAPAPSSDARIDGAPHTRAAAQELARTTLLGFSRYIQNFEAGGFGMPNPDLFFLPSHYSGWPGLCQATAMSIDARPDGAISSKQRFLVVGSFESPPVVIDKNKPGYAASKAWEDGIKANCEARDASTGWFTLASYPYRGGREAWDGARLADGIIAEARNADRLPFALECSQFNPPGTTFCADPRRSLAAIHSADLASIATRTFLHGGVDYLETVIDTHGDPFVELTVRQEAVLKPDRRGMSPFKPVITSVAIAQQMQPIID